MRKQFPKTIQEIMATDERLVVLLGDIGVFGFRHVFSEYPQRIYNIGILEQSTISVAAGLAIQDFVPVVHTIAPFIVERALEQLKDDFGYQQLGGNFVSVGASYDYASLGCTHHCPGDVGILKNIPEMEIILPGSAAEFDSLFKQAYANGHPSYFRLSEESNADSLPVEFGKGLVVKLGAKATVLAVGNMLDRVVSACADLDVTILYYTTLSPFDTQLLRANYNSKIVVCEPYYSGALAHDILQSIAPRPAALLSIGVPRQFLRKYGSIDEHNKHLGLDVVGLRDQITSFIAD